MADQPRSGRKRRFTNSGKLAIVGSTATSALAIDALAMQLCNLSTLNPSEESTRFELTATMLPGPLASLMRSLAFASGAKGMVGQPTMLAALLNTPGLALRTILELLSLKQRRTKSMDSFRINPFNSPINFKIPRRLDFWRYHHRKRGTTSQQ